MIRHSCHLRWVTCLVFAKESEARATRTSRTEDPESLYTPMIYSCRCRARALQATPGEDELNQPGLPFDARRAFTFSTGMLLSPLDKFVSSKALNVPLAQI